jgi:hypothetical protein
MFHPLPDGLETMKPQEHKEEYNPVCCFVSCGDDCKCPCHKPQEKPTVPVVEWSEFHDDIAESSNVILLNENLIIIGKLLEKAVNKLNQ